jgi:RND family efflux transporter MFP subunit
MKTELTSPKRPRRWLWRIVALLIAGAGALVGLKSMHGAAAGPIVAPGPMSVAVAKVARQDLFNQVTIPGEFRPYTEVELHAKVSGYLAQINVDIGDRVREGQVLAQLDAPDVVAQLNSAIASEEKAAATCTNAHLTLARLNGVRRQNASLISQQDIDNADASDRTATAALAVARADRERFQTMVDYLRITAPFNGVVTRRNADPGALIQAGTASATQSLPLVQLSDNYKLRLDFEVSVGLVHQIHVGDTVEVRVDSAGGKVYSGTISRRAEKVDGRTRTMTAEVDVPNPELELVPGMYATVLLRLDRHPGALSIPIESVASSDQRSSVLVVNADNQVEERAVTLGLETPGNYEVLNGLKEGELVVVGNRAQTRAGQKVTPKIRELQVTP